MGQSWPSNKVGACWVAPYQINIWPKPLLRGLNLCESPVTPMIWNFLASAIMGYICIQVMMSSSISISWQKAAGWIKGSRIHSIISAIYVERFGLSCSIQFRAALYRFQFLRWITNNPTMILLTLDVKILRSVSAIWGNFRWVWFITNHL